MQRTITADLNAPPQRVFEMLSDLTQYPEWLDLVADAEPAPAADGDTGPAWFITLRAKVGPFARSKRLRMQRTVADEPTHLVFERREIDGREHAGWTLEVQIDDAAAPAPGPTPVTVELRYDGGLWTAPLEGVLGRQIDDAVPRLQALVAP